MSRDFWSRRREAVAKEAQAEEAAIIASEEAEREATLAETSDEDLLAEAGLPAPEDLESPEAVREFLSSALPQRLKARALRKLWRLNPVLANVDGLVDYGEDFTDSAMVIENLQTTYQVGKGMLRHIEEMARQAEAAEEPQEEPEVEVEDNALVAAVELEDEPDMTPAELPTFTADDADDNPPPSSRRMTFTFDQQRIG